MPSQIILYYTNYERLIPQGCCKLQQAGDAGITQAQSCPHLHFAKGLQETLHNITEFGPHAREPLARTKCIESSLYWHVLITGIGKYE